MNLKWYRFQRDGTTTFLHEGKGVDDSPGLEALQKAVGGHIERVPDYFMVFREDVGNPNYHRPYELTLYDADNEKEIVGQLVQVFVNEDSKMPLYGITERVQAMQYVTDNLSPLSFIMQPHDFILGDVVVCLTDVQESDPEPYPDWMKGMNEEEYAEWAESWQEHSNTQPPSDENED
jgi:hypothetical protein